MRTLRISTAVVILLLWVLTTLIAQQHVSSDKNKKNHDSVAAAKAELSNPAKTAVAVVSSAVVTPKVLGAASNGPDIVAPPNATSLGAIKFLPDGTYVCVNQKVVTWLRNCTFYVEELDGSSGIRVEIPTNFPTPNSIGNIVSFTGVLKTGLYDTSEYRMNYERYIELVPSDCLQIHNPGNPVPPVPFIDFPQNPDNPYDPYCSIPASPVPYIGLKQKSVGGRPLTIFTPAFPSSIYMFNIGLTAKLWGRVTSTNQYEVNDGMAFFYIDDGSKVKDGSSYGGQNNVGIRVRTEYGCPPLGEFVWVAGVIGTDWWDPTPYDPVIGDEGMLIPVLRTDSDKDIKIIDPLEPAGPTVITPASFAQVTGRVRTAGQTEPGIKVRVYCPTSSIFVHNVVGNQWSSFTLNKVPSTGTAVTFSAPGYISQTVIVRPNQSTTLGDIELLPFNELSIDIFSDAASIKSCSEEFVTLKVLLRDCEGKGIAGKPITLTTTRGSFVENNQKTISGMSDTGGVFTVKLRAAPDGPGIAQVTASEQRTGGASKLVSIEFTGLSIKSTAEPLSPPIAGSRLIRAFVYDEEKRPLGNASVYFSTTEGGFQEASGASTYSAITSDADNPLTGVKKGEARATLVMSQSGAAVVSIRCIDQCGNESISWTIVSNPGQAWKQINTGYSNLLVTDFDYPADNSREIVAVDLDGKMHVWRRDGSLLWETGAATGLGANNTPSAANLDHDPEGRLELVLPTANVQANVFAYDALTGHPLAGWPTLTFYVFKYVSAAIADVNLDGALEIIAGDDCCYVFSWNGTGDWERKTTARSSFNWLNLTENSGTEINASSPAIGDLDHDARGMLDVAVGTNSAPYGVYAFPGDAWGDYSCSGSGCPEGQMPPLYLPGWPKTTGYPVRSSPATGDIDGDGKTDMIAMVDKDYLAINRSNVDPITGNGKWMMYNLREAATIEESDPDPSPAIADINMDGYNDIVAATTEGKVFVFDGKAMAQNKILTPADGWEGGIRPSRLWNPDTDTYTDSLLRSSPVIGDVNDDGKPEIVIGSTDGNIYALYWNGVNHKDTAGHLTGPLAWAKCCVPSSSSNTPVISSPVIDDVDGDGKVDIVAASTGSVSSSSLGGIFIFPLDATYHPERMPWPTFHHDIARTGTAASMPSLKYGSIVGRVTNNGDPVDGYYIGIKHNDNNVVYQPTPYQSTPRKPVRTAGAERNTEGTFIRTEEANRAGYSINQLESGRTYKILIWATEPPDPQQTPPIKTVTDVSIPEPGGLVRLDIDLAQ